MKIISLSRFVGLFALAVFFGCGGGSGLVPDGSAGGGGSSGTCKNAAACGGSIVGTWKITSSCVTVDAAAMMNMACPTETGGASGITITGTVTYNADMTYSANTTMSGNVVVTLPASCLSPEGGTVTCDELTQAIRGATGTMYESIECVGAGSGCSCTFVLVDQMSTETGTFSTTAAGVLTETATGGPPDESDYCIKGTTLTESPHAGSAMAGQGSISGTITLTKQ